MSGDNKKQSLDEILSPPRHTVARLVIIVAGTILTVETLLMFMFDRMTRHLTFTEDFLDGILLTILVSPALYLYLFRPMKNYIQALRKAQTLLEEQRDNLEHEVQQRTAELVERNKHQARLVQELKNAEEKYRSLVDRLPSITYISTLGDEEKLAFISQQVDKLGYGVQEWLESPDLRFERMHPDDRDRVRQALQRSYESGDAFNCDYRLYTSANEARWFHDEALVVCDRIEKKMFLQGIMLDVTDKKMMEVEIAERRKLVEQQVRQRTEQLERRIAVLEDANANLTRIIKERRSGPG